jgi:H+/gluconate symporter-like permease
MLITLLVTTFLVALTVLIHFEALRSLSAFMESPHSRFRLALLVCMLGAMMAHVIEPKNGSWNMDST